METLLLWLLMIYSENTLIFKHLIQEGNNTKSIYCAIGNALNRVEKLLGILNQHSATLKLQCSRF